MFLDSCQSIVSSLENLTKNFTRNKFKHLRRYLELLYGRDNRQRTMSNDLAADESVEDEIVIVTDDSVNFSSNKIEEEVAHEEDPVNG